MSLSAGLWPDSDIYPKLDMGKIETYLSGKLWKTEALIWEGRVIDQMPVEHIEFIIGHDIL